MYSFMSLHDAYHAGQSDSDLPTQEVASPHDSSASIPYSIPAASRPTNEAPSGQALLATQQLHALAIRQQSLSLSRKQSSPFLNRT